MTTFKLGRKEFASHVLQIVINVTTVLNALSVSLDFLSLQMALAYNVLLIATVVMQTTSVIVLPAEVDSSWSQSVERNNVRNALPSVRNAATESASKQELDTHSTPQKISAINNVKVRVRRAVSPTHLYALLAYQDTN